MKSWNPTNLIFWLFLVNSLVWSMDWSSETYESHLRHLESIKSSMQTSGVRSSAKLIDINKRYEDLTIGLEKIYETKHYAIHYSESGDHAIDTTDLDGNDVPDYLELVEGALEEAWRFYFFKNQFMKPRWLWTEGYPVFLRNISEDSYGLTDVVGVAGDHPETSFKETAGYYSYLTLRNEYSPDLFSNPTNALLSTAVHEMFHSIQVSVDFSHDFWWLEGIATSMEYELYKEEADNRIYLEYLWSFPDVSLAYESSSDQRTFVGPLRIYGIWPFYSYINQKYGMDVSLHMVENSPQISNTLEMVKTSVGEMDSTEFQQIYHDFWSSYFLDSTDVPDSLKSRIQIAGGVSQEFPVNFEGDLDKTQIWNSQVQGNGALFGEGIDFFKVSELISINFSLNKGDSVLIRMFDGAYQLMDQAKVLLNKNYVIENETQEPKYFSVYNLGKSLESAQYKMDITQMTTEQFLKNIRLDYNSDEIWLTSELDIEKIILRLVSGQGQVLHEESLSIQNGFGKIKMPQVSPGLYFLQINLDGNVKLRPILIGITTH